MCVEVVYRYIYFDLYIEIQEKILNLKKMGKEHYAMYYVSGLSLLVYYVSTCHKRQKTIYGIFNRFFSSMAKLKKGEAKNSLLYSWSLWFW